MKYIEELKKERLEYGSIPFWSWNDRLDPERLKEQIRNMHDLGMNGFFMHARSGLETEYLSDEWYNCIKECVDEAGKLGMEAWSYDENGWPSGFAGGILLEDPKNYASYLRMEKKNAFDPDALAVYVIEENRSRHVTENEGEKEYICVYIGRDSSYVDTMNAEITKKFLECTHQDYKNRIGEKFGKAMPGFFTDEPQYYRYATAWSDILPEIFEKKYGYSIFTALDAMFLDFEGAREFRYDYWKLCHELFINNFGKTIYDWCEDNGCRLTGHAVEESFLAGQMWCCGGVMPFYEYEHIPGIDHLARGLGNGIPSKQLGSVCAQLGKKKALSEMYGCCGWDVSPLELKKIAESQYVSGVNIMCQHLFPYSERGQRKRDYPAHYSQHLPWQKEMKHFNEFFNNLGYTLSRGTEIAPALVIHPMHSCWLDYKRFDDSTVSALERGFNKVTGELFDRHIGFHYGDEEILAKYGSAVGNTIMVGLQTYRYVILPDIYSIDSTTAATLKEYAENGGKIFLYGRAPDRIDGRVCENGELDFLKSNVTLDEITEDSEITVSARVRDVRTMYRQTARGRICYIVNLTDSQVDNIEIRFKKAAHLNIFDAEKSVFVRADEEGCPRCGAKWVNISLEPGQSVIVTEFEGEDEKEQKKISAPVKTGNFRLVSKPQNMMTLDKAALSYDGVNYERLRPVELVRDILYRTKYKGELWLKFFFETDEIPGELNVALEPMNLLEVSVNGNPIAPVKTGWFDPSFLSADILPYVKKGTNEIVTKINYFQRDYVYYVLYGGVSESLRNCLVFDTEIENIYLFGDFRLNTPGKFEESVKNSVVYTGDFSVTKADGNVSIENIVESGYPFFAGSMKFEADINYKEGDGTELFLTGRFSTAVICVNGVHAGTVMFGNHINLADQLRPGHNTVTVELYNSNRNLMGPHHRGDPEPTGLGPDTFSYEKQWNGEECPDYHYRYAFVKFGAKI